MKTIIKVRLHYLILVATVLMLAYTNAARSQVSSEIIGVWVGVDPETDEENSSIWEFTVDNKCKWYSNGVAYITFDYYISDTYNGTDHEGSKYLKLVHIENKKSYNYFMNGITSADESSDGRTYLSIEAEGRPRPMLFIKQ